MHSLTESRTVIEAPTVIGKVERIALAETLCTITDLRLPCICVLPFNETNRLCLSIDPS